MLLVAEPTQMSNKWKREVDCLELESALLEWFLHYEKDGPISGERLLEKARKLYDLMYPRNGVPLLKFCNGGLGSFTARHEIQEYRRHGEFGSADVNTIEQQWQEIANFFAYYEYEDIYNMDETGML